MSTSSSKSSVALSPGSPALALESGNVGERGVDSSGKGMGEELGLGLGNRDVGFRTVHLVS